MGIKVDGHNQLYRDEQTQAIINKDKEEYDSYILRRNKLRREREEIKNLKNEVSDLKKLITTLIEKIDG